MSEQASFQQLLVTNFGLSPSGYTGSRGDVGYVGSAGAGGGGASPKISAITYPGDDTAADPVGGQTVTLTGTGFVTGALVIINGAQVGVVSVVNSTTITFTAPALATGSYIVYVVNPDGGTALAVPGIQYSGTPAWTTSAGTLGTTLTQVSFTANLTATGDAPVTYSVYSGSLPAGLTLSANTGVISGTTPNVASNTTYSFTVRSTDAQRQDTDRTFSITVVPSNPPPTVDFLVVAGGGGGGAGRSTASYGSGGGGGAGGYRTSVGTSGGGGSAESAVAVNFGTTYTVTVGAGGAAGVDGVNTAPNGTNSVFSTITSIGGGGGAAYPIAGSGGGSGGGGHPGGGAGTTNQGYAGGISSDSVATGDAYGAGGGGGAGAVGTNGTMQVGGTGGVGVASSISGSSVFRAGGGGGGVYTLTWPAGTGGNGGGGSANNTSSPYTAANGVFATGGGGGGASLAISSGTGPAAGSGGSGVVIIRYTDSYSPAESTTGNPTVTTSSGYRVYTWTTSGSITF